MSLTIFEKYEKKTEFPHVSVNIKNYFNFVDFQSYWSLILKAVQYLTINYLFDHVFIGEIYIFVFCSKLNKHL